MKGQRRREYFQKLGDCPQIVVKRLIRISRRDPGCFGEINAKTQRCKDAKEDPGCFGSGSPVEIPAVSVVDFSGCFIEGTLFTVSSIPGQSNSTDSLWSDPSWLDEPSQKTPWLSLECYATVATPTELQVPIESVPIGARVPTKNPNRFEVDPQPEPDQATWAKLSITVERSDGGIVDAEIIRPRSCILANGLCAGRMLPLSLPQKTRGLSLQKPGDCPCKNPGTVPELVRETTAMN